MVLVDLIIAFQAIGCINSDCIAHQLQKLNANVCIEPACWRTELSHRSEESIWLQILNRGFIKVGIRRRLNWTIKTSHVGGNRKSALLGVLDSYALICTEFKPFLHHSPMCFLIISVLACTMPIFSQDRELELFPHLLLDLELSFVFFMLMSPLSVVNLRFLLIFHFLKFFEHFVIEASIIDTISFRFFALVDRRVLMQSQIILWLIPFNRQKV